MIELFVLACIILAAPVGQALAELANPADHDGPESP